MWAIVLLSLALNVVAPSARSVVTVADEAHILILVNQQRAEQGMAPLRSDPSLVRAARAHSARMATTGRIWHTPSLHAAAKGWRVLGENVALASAPNDTVRYFMGSPEHRDLILDRLFTHAGVGVTRRDGSLFVTVFFGFR